MAKKQKGIAPEAVLVTAATVHSPISSKFTNVAILILGILIGHFATKLSSSNINLGGSTSSAAPSAVDEEAAFQQAIDAWDGELVDHVPYSEITYQEFVGKYQVNRMPIVIEGMYADNPLTEGVDDERWGWMAQRDRYGDVLLETRVEGGGRGCTGTGLCEGRPIALRKLLDDYFLRDLGRGKKTTPYPHDIELKSVLPEMFDVYKKSFLFAENLLLPTKHGKDRWPSLFYGTRGTRTNLHVDSMGTSSTMAVFRGRKQFLLVPAQDGDKLCVGRPTRGLEYGVGKDPFDPDFVACPEARQAKAMFADVKAGDILFIPGHTHHAARNLNHSLGISQNFLTVQDYHSIMEDMSGYLTKIRRKLKKKAGQIPVTMDFLSIRDLFRVLAETKFITTWAFDKPFWNADDATKESYRRVMSHMKKVIEDDPTQATRLAYFTNPELLILSLKAAELWECLDGNDKVALETPPTGVPKISDQEVILNVVTKALTESRECNKTISKNYIDEVEEVRIPKAVKTMDGERGLSPYCCGDQKV